MTKKHSSQNYKDKSNIKILKSFLLLLYWYTVLEKSLTRAFMSTRCVICDMHELTL